MSAPRLLRAVLAVALVAAVAETRHQSRAKNKPYGEAALPKPPFDPEVDCRLPEKMGDCRAKIPRWAYNPHYQGCQLFYYGGCRGNANNFYTQSECSQACKGVSQPGKRVDPEKVCQLPLVTGPCFASFRRWGYNPEKKRCQEFMYSGCGGNDNNFRSKDECHQTCRGVAASKPKWQRHPQEVCLLPEDDGMCLAAIPRWSYNAVTNECQEFIYGGCMGNENNFLSRRACQQTCAGVQSVRTFWRHPHQHK